MKRIEDLHSEQAYLKSLRYDDSDEDTGDEQPEPQEEESKEAKSEDD